MADKKRDDDDRRVPHPGAGPAARTPQEDHTPRQEEQAAREHREEQRGQGRRREPRDKAALDKQQAELRAGWAAASIGAQVVLDFNEDGSLGARGGAAGTIEGNMIARDTWLGEMGLDPVDCSGPPRPRMQDEMVQRETPPLPDARATKVSSLAAGISQGMAGDDSARQQRARA
jgi:hypothetical protein